MSTLLDASAAASFPPTRVRTINLSPRAQTAAEALELARKAVAERVARDRASFLVHFEECQGIVALACKKQRITRATYQNWRAADPEFAASCAEIEESTLDLVEARLLKNIHNGNIASTIFYLKTKGKRRGYVERTELTGANGASLGGPVINIADLKKDISPTSMRKLLEEIAAIENAKSNGPQFPNRDDDRGAKPFAERTDPTRFARAPLPASSN